MQLNNHFLIATPQCNDPLFKQSVVFVCDHNDQGTMGLIINKPSDISVAEICTKVNFMMANTTYHAPQPVLAGGPVKMEHGFILHKITPQPFHHSVRISDNLMLSTSPDVLEALGGENAPSDYLITLGCASWSPNQLEQEIIQNDWLIVKADESILFHTPYPERWQKATALLGITTENIAHQTGVC